MFSMKPCLDAVLFGHQAVLNVVFVKDKTVFELGFLNCVFSWTLETRFLTSEDLAK